MKLKKVVPLACAVVSLLGLAALPAFGEDAGALKDSAILNKLLAQTGVYDRSKTGKDSVAGWLAISTGCTK
jgi:hypothetical protein